MISLNIIGSGNVATHLATAFSGSGKVRLQQLFSRQPNAIAAPEGVEILHDLSFLRPADVTLIAVSDDAIGAVSKALPFSGHLVVHTSGSQPFTILDAKNRRGVFYPLQTFSKTKEVSFPDVPLCLEAEDVDDMTVLKELASSLSSSVHEVDATQRRALHVAAVFVSNFTNHLYGIGAKICEENRLDFELLKPLIRETADKVMTLPPSEAQTGPAQRNDRKTLDAHRAFLGDRPEAKLYEILTQSIRNGQL